MSVRPSTAEVFLLELYNQCKFAIQAHSAAYSALDRFGQAPTDTFGPGRRYQRQVFRNLYSLIVHARNNSSLLWPPDTADDDAQDRAEKLRRILETPEDGHVLKGDGFGAASAPYG